MISKVRVDTIIANALYSLPEAAKILGYTSHVAVHYLIKKGYIKQRHLALWSGTPNRKRYKIYGVGLLEYIENL